MNDSGIITPKFSELFNAPDSDLTVQSSDGTLFKVHKKYLEFGTGAFPPADIETRDEIVVLSEPAVILELLFQIMYPRRNPDLGTLEFDALLALAEAAEKYEVYSAIHVCILTMQCNLPAHVTEVLAYAAKHRYDSVLDRVAPFAFALPPGSVADLLTPELMAPWIRYYSKACQVLFAATTEIDRDHSGVSLTPTVIMQNRCPSWSNEISKKLLIELGKGPEVLLHLDILVPATRAVEWKTCAHTDCSCKIKPAQWKTWVQSRFDGIGKFSTYIR